MCAGRVKRCHGSRLVLLVTVVHIQAADAKSGSQENVILIVAVISFIFLTSLAYFTVSCGYYHCVYKNQIAGKESGSREDIVHPNLSVSVSSYGVSVLDGNDGPDKAVIGDRSLQDNSYQEMQDPILQKGLPRQEKREEGSAREGLGPSDLDLPEVLHQPEHVEVIEYGTSRADSGAENAPPMPQLRPRQPPGYAKSTSPQLESVLGEAQDPTQRCCTVWDMCSPGWSLSEGLPPAGAIAGPPSDPCAPSSMPRGRLQL